MSITEQILNVGEGGRVVLQIPRPAGARIRVMVWDLSELPPQEAMAFADLQSDTGFARQVLADPAEDVWNEL